jgi:hypothetical protein
LVIATLLADRRASAENVEQTATYVSQIDQELTIRRIALLPIIDNVEGIYARPIEAQLTQLLKTSHRWDFVDTNIATTASNLPTLVELEESPNQLQRLVQPIEADAFVGATISRGPAGISLRVDIFLKKDGKVISQEVLRDHPRFELPEIRLRVADLYRKAISRIPYDGFLLSRQGNRVTLNLGKSDGINKDQILPIVQVIAINRHPKFNFLISSEKEIIGRLKILKVDETLSFGAIITEREKGAVQRLAKVSVLEQVSYPEPTRLEEGSASSDIGSRPDAAVTFGKEPKEWLPVRPPSFGQVSARVGLGTFDSSVALSDSGTLAAKAPYYPSVGIAGELWLTPEWTTRADILQGVLSTSNPRTGATNGTLNQSLSRYSLDLGYNFLLRDDFFGPKVGISGGFAMYRMYVDSSTPDAFETVTYSGFYFGLNGSFPVTDNRHWFMGGRLNLFFLPAMSEAPRRSGASSRNTINEFSLFVENKIAENMRAFGALDFSLYGSNLTGQGTRVGPQGSAESATTLSQRHTVLNFGINYMF